MPVLEFQDETRFQDYPLGGENPTLVDGGSNSVSIDRGWILDAGFVVGPGGGSTSGSGVFLTGIQNTGTDWRFTVQVGTGLSSGQSIDVDVSKTADEPGVTKILESDPTAPGLRGFIQFGDLSTLPGDLTGEVEFLPSLVEWEQDTRVSGIRVANQVATVPWDEECQGAKPSYDEYEEATGGTSVVGDVKLRAGRNVEILQVQQRNQLSIGVTSSPNAGGEAPCGDSVEVYPTGVSLEETACNEVLHTINGVAPSPRTQAFTFSGSRGVSFSQGSNPNELVMKINTPVLFKRFQDSGNS